jgi:D-alanyl-D-alanine carboxypeptidase
VHLNSRHRRLAVFGALAGLLGLVAASPLRAAPSILVDAVSGDVLQQQDATKSWFPASTTKLMTVYVALDAVTAGRMSLNTPLMVSPRAASMAPSKMGFRPGTQVTLDNALKMLMVQSANDIAITIAEGISGSVEGFSDEMNAAAAKLGMRESHFENPNGLPDSRHVSSARDLAVLARALLQRFPDHADLYDIGAMRLGRRIYGTHNGLLGRYPGADGMKTGFTCAAGFNVVATASRGGRRLIAVVLGAPSGTARNLKAASLFDVGFSGRGSNGGSLTSLASYGVQEAPDMRNGVCRNRAKANAAYLAEIEDTAIPLKNDYSAMLSNQPERSFLTFGAATAPQRVSRTALLGPRPVFTPVDVFVGPIAGWTGVVAHPNDYAGPPAGPQTAYASDKAGESPLPEAEDALPMKRGHKAVRHGHRAEKVAKAKAAKSEKVAKAKGSRKHEAKAGKVAKATKPAKTAVPTDKRGKGGKAKHAAQ